MADDSAESNAVELATELTIAWLSNPNTRANAGEVPDFLKAMHGAVQGLEGQPATVQEAPASGGDHVAAVTARRSLASKDHIISMIDGKPYKTLRRHLSTHGMSPEDYRQRYGLQPDYPSYAEMRRDMAKRIGLGRKPRAAAPEGEAPAAAKPRRRAAAKKGAE